MDDDTTKGAQGKTGETGGPGGQGERGRTGDPGRVGDTGKTGDTGESGGTGAEGEKGRTGPVGPPGDPGPKGPDGVRHEVDTKAVVNATIDATTKVRDRRTARRAFLGGLIAACLVMIPVSIAVSEQQVKDRAKVSELEAVIVQQHQILSTVRGEVARNCRRFRRLASINEKDTKKQQAASDRFLASGDTFGLTPQRLAKLIRESRDRDRALLADYRSLARADCAVSSNPGP